MKQVDDILKDVDNLLDVFRNPDMRKVLLSRIEVACEALVGIEVKPDRGPWTVSDDGRVISSDDFDHDVQLKVGGDFYDDDTRRAYSIALANLLNGKLPKDPPGGLLESMALRYRHDFGLDKEPDAGPLQAGCTSEERQAVIRMMRQLYEEVAGHGFYQKG